MRSSGYKDVDYVLTTRELARMIREAGIDFNNLPDSEPEELMGMYTGAALSSVLPAVLWKPPSVPLINWSPVKSLKIWT
jgi:iron only hydrogenase large subunit-like protein